MKRRLAVVGAVMFALMLVGGLVGWVSRPKEPHRGPSVNQTEFERETVKQLTRRLFEIEDDCRSLKRQSDELTRVLDLYPGRPEGAPLFLRRVQLDAEREKLKKQHFDMQMELSALGAVSDLRFPE